MFYKIIKGLSDTPQYEHISGIILFDREVLEQYRKVDYDFDLRFAIADMGYDVRLIIGDGKYDLEVLPYVGMSVCPADAIREAQLRADFVLHRAGGDGCVWELLSILAADRRPDGPESYFNARMAEHQLIFKRMASDQPLVARIMSVGQALVERLREGGQLFFCGNGGSAVDAQHIAAEFVGRFYQERPALCAEALTTNTSILTAIGNDYGYERIFVRQLEAKARPEAGPCIWWIPWDSPAWTMCAFSMNRARPVRLRPTGSTQIRRASSW